MTRTVTTFCRICEAGCGLEADVEDGRVVELRPDRDHVVTQGYVCMKGVRYKDVHHSPDRVTQPLKRVGERFEPISWDQALSEIGAKLRQLVDKHGPDAVGLYAGNPLAFNMPHVLFANGLMRAIGSSQTYGAGSQDCNNKFATSWEMYGSPLVQPIPDIDRIRCFVIVGSNPAVSQMSFVNAPRPIERLKAIEKAGARVVFVNPRRTESAKQVGEQLFIRPGTDVFFMLSFAHELFAQGGADARAAEHLENVDALRRVVEAWPAERTAEVTGIAPEALRDLVRSYCNAEGAALYASTGLSQGEHGTLAFWLLSAINAVSGNLDRRGGMLVPKALAALMAKLELVGVKLPRRYSRIGGFPALLDMFPAGILPDEITTPGRGQIRAMLVTAGNPLLSCANGRRMAEALSELELLVSVDLFRNETGNLAHYILPVPSFLEREDIPLSSHGWQPVPYEQFTEAVVPAAGETKEEWWIFTRLIDAAGWRMFGPLHHYLVWSTRQVEGPLAKLQFAPRKLMTAALALKGQWLNELRKHYPHGKLRGEPRGGTFLGKWVPRKGGKVDVAPAAYVQGASELDASFRHERDNLGKLKLITKRERHTHNSWMHNVDSFVAGARKTNYLYIHPEDAEQAGLADGTLATVRTETGSITLPAKLSDDLMRGVVAVPHGWGHQKADGLSVASKTLGVNVNELAADGPQALEKLSGMTKLTGLTVEVAAAAKQQSTAAE